MEGLGYGNSFYTAMDAGSTVSGAFLDAEFAPGGCCDITKHTYELRTRYLVMYQPAGEDSNLEEDNKYYRKTDYAYLVDQVTGLKAKTQDTKSITLTLE